MKNTKDRFDNIDVICEMKGDGTIVPLRLKFADDDGAVHEYTIKGYRVLSNAELFHLPDAGYKRCNFVVIVCRVVDFGRIIEIMLYYDKNLSRWWMCPGRHSP